MKIQKKKLALFLLIAVLLCPGSRMTAEAAGADNVVSAVITEQMAKGIKVYRAEIDFDPSVYEEPQLSGMKPQNGFGRLIYNPSNHRFILTCESGNTAAGTILSIHMKRKSSAGTGDTTVRLKNVMYSDGVQDLKGEEVKQEFSRSGEKEPETGKKKPEDDKKTQPGEMGNVKKQQAGKVRTGDDTKAGLLILLCAGSAAVMLFVLRKKKNGILFLIIAMGCSLGAGSTVSAGTVRDGDIEALEKYLVQAGTLKDEAEFDLNSDNKVSLTDLALLLTVNRYRYEETNEKIQNPDIGFYNTRPVACKAEGTERDLGIGDAAGLVHFRIGLGAFSAAGGGEDIDITQDALDALDSYMEKIRKAGGTAIIRFAYDNFDGKSNTEPGIALIVKHIGQLKPFFTKNADVIACVETGMLGPWGEQHSSTAVTPENMKAVTEAFLKAVPADRTVNVRRPLWYCHVTGTEIGNIHENITRAGTDAYRIGVFNDGYLGSSTDLGTFVNRKKEISWLSNQALHTLYGGEAVSAGIQDKDENGYLYNSPEHMMSEMFVTHTSYLNAEWNDSLLKKWKETPYQGKDKKYKGKSAYEYIENHLGYRFVLTLADIPVKPVSGEQTELTAAVKNIGAGSVVNEKEAVLILKNDEHTCYIEQSVDIRKLKPDGTSKLKFTIPASRKIEKGTYEVYLKFQNKGETKENTKRCIRFASEGIWNQDLAANRLGEIRIGY